MTKTLRPACLGLAANLLAADDAYDLPLGLATKLQDMVASFAAPMIALLGKARGREAKALPPAPSYLALRRLGSAASMLACLLLRSRDSEARHAQLLLPISAIRATLSAIVRLEAPYSGLLGAEAQPEEETPEPAPAADAPASTVPAPPSLSIICTPFS